MKLLPCMMLLAPLMASTVTMDFNTASAPANTSTNISNPWNEDYLTLTCLNPVNNNLSELAMVRYPANDTGVKSASAKFTRGLLRLETQSGLPLTVKSMRLFPLSGNAGSASITFTGHKTTTAGGGTVSTTFSPGSNIAGVVRTFPTTFDDLDSMTWEVNNNVAGFGYHQFDDITVEIPSIITVPDDIVISEGSGPVTLALKRDATSTGNLNVVGNVAGSASHPSDYSRSIATPQVFAFTGSVTEIPFTIEASDDAFNESPETIVLNWASSPSYTLSRPSTTITIGDTDGAGFPDYVAGHGLTGNDALPDADPNEDGISNIEAYAYRMNPAGPSASGALTRLPGFTLQAAGRNNYPAITWQLPSPLPSDVRFRVWETGDLDAWSNIATRTGYGVGSLWTGSNSGSVSDTGNPLRTVIVPGSQPINSTDKAFLRLELEYVATGGSSN